MHHGSIILRSWDKSTGGLPPLQWSEDHNIEFHDPHSAFLLQASYASNQVGQLASEMDIPYFQPCPSCDNTSMLTSQTEYEVEHCGAVLLSVSVCQRCGYRHSDVIALSNREAVALTVKVSSLDDLNMRVIKSGTATINIPEFGATITPGPNGEGYVSNVEGLLAKIEDALTFMLSTAKGERLKRGERMLKKMRMAREAKPRFTLVIKDPLGNSAIVSPTPGRIRKRKLTKRELQTIKFGQYAILEDVTHVAQH